MRTSRFIAVVFGLVLFSSACLDLGLADQTDFRLKYSWPSLDVDMMPGTAPQPQLGVIGGEASINMWGDRLGLLTSLEMGEFKLHGIAGTYIPPELPAQRIYQYETQNKIIEGVYNLDMRMFIGNFIRRWSDAELKLLRDLNLAVIVGWNWQDYRFNRTLTEISIQGHPGEAPDPHLLPWADESGYDKDHGGSYHLRASGVEVGASSDWAPFAEFETDALKQIGVHVLGRYAPGLRAEYFGVKWQDTVENLYAANCEASVTYDFAKLLGLKEKEALTAGLGYEWQILDGSNFNRIVSHGAMFTVTYGFPHSW